MSTPGEAEESVDLPATAWAVLGMLSFGRELSGYDLKKWADKYGIQVELTLVNDYIESINLYTAGKFDACTMTNMDALTIPAVGGIDSQAVIVGDFSAGNSGFGSGYAFAATDDCLPPGVYDIVLQPRDCHASWASFGDHTSGDGNMMAINGADIASVEVWSKTVLVVPQTRYYFSTWIASSSSSLLAWLTRQAVRGCAR